MREGFCVVLCCWIIGSGCYLVWFEQGNKDEWFNVACRVEAMFLEMKVKQII